jgi:hypothetical protein
MSSPVGRGPSFFPVASLPQVHLNFRVSDEALLLCAGLLELGYSHACELSGTSLSCKEETRECVLRMLGPHMRLKLQLL